jgi:hypothetical protein
MKIENQKISTQCWAAISARALALLAWPSGTAGPCQPVLHMRAQRNHRALAAHTVA